MAKGWRKNDYNREKFGQQVREYRLALQWSLGQLAQLSGLNKGTLQHVEKGEVRLPDAKRQTLIDVLAEALQGNGQTTNRQELLNSAGLSGSRILKPVSSLSQLQSEGNSQEESLRGRPHEEYAELLNQRGEWQLAGTFWLLAALEAKHAGNWATWSRCLLHAGLMALTCSQFEIAERRFKEVIEGSHAETALIAVVEAYLRLGWLYYEQDKFSLAAQLLLKSKKLLQNAVSKNLGSLRFSEHGSILPYEGRELVVALEATRLHWLGRTYVDWGMQQDNHALIKEGLTRLQKSRHYDSQLGLSGNVGLAFLRQIPALLYEGELATTEKYLAQSEELLDRGGTTKGHLYLHRGLLALEERPEKAKDLLENAREGFVEPILYARGLSEVFKETSGAYLMDDRKTGDERAVEYAFVAAVLHPYGRNIELLQLAAHKMYWRMGENGRVFNTFWHALGERFWSMESEPFSDLRYLMKSFPENGIAHVETAVEKVNKAIQAELLEEQT